MPSQYIDTAIFYRSTHWLVKYRQRMSVLVIFRTRFVSLLIVLLAVAAVPRAMAQRHELNVDVDSDSGNFLAIAMDVDDVAKRIGLYEQFTKQHPKNDAIPWILEQLQTLYIEMKEPGKAIEAGDRLLAADPEDVEAALINVKVAEEKKDAALAAKWKERAAAASARVLVTATETQRGGTSDEIFAERVELAAQIQGAQDVALYNKAVAERDPQKRLVILDDLAKKSPAQDLSRQIDMFFYVCYRDTNNTAKALAAAEKILTYDQTHEDILYFLANTYFRQKREHQKVLGYAAKMLALMATKARPPHISEANWINQKNLILQQGNFMQAVIQMNRDHFAAADKFFRAALPFARGNNRLTANILSSLGWCNYQMKVPLEAIRFYQECARLQGPYQDQAAQSILAIKSEFGLAQ